MHTTHKIVLKNGADKHGHQPDCSEAFSMRIWQFLEMILMHGNICIKALGAFWISAIQGAMRTTHLQRSRVVLIHDWYLDMESSRGQNRKGGHRQPFQWTLPRFTPFGFDVWKALEAVQKRFMEGTALEELPPYLLPDFGPPGCHIAHVTYFLPRAMPPRKALAILQELLQGHPLYLTKGQAA